LPHDEQSFLLEQEQEFLAFPLNLLYIFIEAEVTASAIITITIKVCIIKTS